MMGKSFLKGLGVFVALSTLWHYLTPLLLEDGDNRNSLDPNG